MMVPNVAPAINKKEDGKDTDAPPNKDGYHPFCKACKDYVDTSIT
jgi:hypothetical protein